MTIIIPFISHVEKQISPEDAQKIAEILGLPHELCFLSLTIDENLNMRAFARGLSNDMPFHYGSTPLNWLAQEAPKPPPEMNGTIPTIAPDTPAPDSEGSAIDLEAIKAQWMADKPLPQEAYKSLLDAMKSETN